jgi:hypothetical protein
MKTTLNEWKSGASLQDVYPRPPVDEIEHIPQKKKVAKNFKNEYFLIIWQEGGDETHFMLMDMAHYDVVQNTIPKLFGKFSGNHQKFIEGFLQFCYDSQTLLPDKKSEYWIQTYCDDPWPFEGYNIVRIISLPEFGS